MLTFFKDFFNGHMHPRARRASRETERDSRAIGQYSLPCCCSDNSYKVYLDAQITQYTHNPMEGEVIN